MKVENSSDNEGVFKPLTGSVLDISEKKDNDNNNAITLTAKPQQAATWIVL